MMGSGGMIVMDDHDLHGRRGPLLHQLPGRRVVRQVHALPRRSLRPERARSGGICNGEGREGDIEFLEELSATIRDTSLCQLGGSAPNPVLSTLRYFRDEYLEHIREKRCRGGVCKELIAYSILPEMCDGCAACGRACPTGAIEGEVRKTALHPVQQVHQVRHLRRDLQARRRGGARDGRPENQAHGQRRRDRRGQGLVPACRRARWRDSSVPTLCHHKDLDPDGQLPALRLRGRGARARSAWSPPATIPVRERDEGRDRIRSACGSTGRCWPRCTSAAGRTCRSSARSPRSAASPSRAFAAN